MFREEIMIRMKTSVLLVIVFSVLTWGVGAVAQPTEFIIGGDFLGGVVMPNNGAALAPNFLDTLSRAGFTHLFLLVDTLLATAANQEITNAHGFGMGIILGHCEGEPDQDYWVQTRGNRWKFHPEDENQFPRSEVSIGEAIDDDPEGLDADPEASIYSRTSPRDAWWIEDAPRGTIVDTLNMRPELRPADTLTLCARLRLRITDPMTYQDSVILRVIIHDSGIPDPGIDVMVRGNTLKRTPQTLGTGVPLASDQTYGEVILGS